LPKSELGEYLRLAAQQYRATGPVVQVADQFQRLIECILEPLSPAGGEGRVRGFQDALIVDPLDFIEHLS